MACAVEPHVVRQLERGGDGERRWPDEHHRLLRRHSAILCAGPGRLHAALFHSGTGTHFRLNRQSAAGIDRGAAERALPMIVGSFHRGLRRATLLRHVGQLMRDFVRDRRAVAVVEFAIVMPLMLMLTMGTFEATRAVRAKMKADFAAQTFADLIAAQNAVDSVALTNFCNGAQMVMVPYT